VSGRYDAAVNKMAKKHWNMLILKNPHDRRFFHPFHSGALFESTSEWHPVKPIPGSAEITFTYDEGHRYSTYTYDEGSSEIKLIVQAQCPTCGETDQVILNTWRNDEMPKFAEVLAELIDLS
jgi:hypothetical protein